MCTQCSEDKPTLVVVDEDPQTGYFHEIELCWECWRRRGKQ